MLSPLFGMMEFAVCLQRYATSCADQNGELFYDQYVYSLRSASPIVGRGVWPCPDTVALRGAWGKGRWGLGLELGGPECAR
jgi:hypothetical protein